MTLASGRLHWHLVALKPVADGDTYCIDRATAIEALRRSQYKFPGQQKIIVSKNWGFTPLRREEYIAKRKEGKVKIDGAYVKFLRAKGPLGANMEAFPDAFGGEGVSAAGDEDEEEEDDDE